MGDVIKSKVNRFIFILLLCTVVLVSYSLFLVDRYENKYGINENKVRIDYNDLVFQVEAIPVWDEQSLHSITNQDFALLSMDGKVVYSQGLKYKTGDNIDLHTLSIIVKPVDEYRIPVMKNGVQQGLLLIGIDRSVYRIQDFGLILLFVPFILLLFLIIFCLYSLYQLFHIDIIKPVIQLHQSTKSMLEHDFEHPITYDYDGEIGTLCHDFELMRSELYDSTMRERDYKRKETLLLASISHDLKTPLATITNYAEGILYDLVEEREDIKEYASVILKKVTTLNRLVEDILEHSKAHLNQFTIEKEEVYTSVFFSEILKILKLDAMKKGVILNDSEIPDVMIEIDKKRMAQVLTNLVDNSIKYKSECGKIDITFELEEQFFVVSVKDNGQGMKAADLPFIFEPFYRGDKSRTQEIPGSGLGLNISKYIVEKHGGKIECDSIYGVGTTVTFSIPLC